MRDRLVLHGLLVPIAGIALTWTFMLTYGVTVEVDRMNLQRMLEWLVQLPLAVASFTFFGVLFFGMFLVPFGVVWTFVCVRCFLPNVPSTESNARSQSRGCAR
jgi:hypothetical protein